MLRVPCGPEFDNSRAMNVDIPLMDMSTDADLAAAANFRRPRSHSYYSPEDAKHYRETKETEEVHIRPRSRSFYSYETSEGYNEGNFTRSNAMRPRASSPLQGEATKKQKSGDGIMARLLTKRSKANKNSTQKDINGSKGSLKGVPMLTISESDNWEISSSSGMKYGQFVDWEKIDPESAVRYQKILKSDHQELKAMGRAGYWSMPHTLRAKAYYHIIHSITCRSVTPNRDIYQELARQLFGEHKMSTHPFPEYMEDGLIPRYCLNKAGLNSVKKILLCIGKHFSDINYCPILPALVSLLLHFSEDEAECFHSICCLIAYNDPNKRYIDQTFLTYRASCMTFGDLANKFCRGVRKLIAASNQNLFEFYSDWIMWIFADLPFTYAIRVLDVYLLEGYKVLYRVALALLSLYKVSVASRVAHVDDFRQDMKSFVQNITRHITTEKLMERAFSIQLATRKELNFLFNANKDALIQKGINKHQNRHLYITVDLENFSSSVVTGTEMRIVWAWIPERFALFHPILLFSTSKHGHSLASLYSHVEGHEPTVLLLKTVDEEVCGAFLSSDWMMRKKHEGEGLDFFGTGECFVFTLRPGMERYQRPILHLPDALDRNQSWHKVQGSGQTSFSSENKDIHAPVPLTCPAGTPQNPNYLTIPFTAPSAGPAPGSPKRVKAQRPLSASMFMAGDSERLVIGGGGGEALCIGANLRDGQTERSDTFESAPLCKAHFKIQSLEVWGIQNSVTVPPISQ
ncbi:TBC1 domain family member 24-like [Megalops cyprinoides]|uniref:TBC1 domain family member 24-like n=1 Tax=Megalops cyprinoides TaxID=118141 RepID=UPI001865650C|nr:TBC1 domain family member 24-like [Megalops cyprinoides]